MSYSIITSGYSYDVLDTYTSNTNVLGITKIRFGIITSVKLRSRNLNIEGEDVFALTLVEEWWYLIWLQKIFIKLFNKDYKQWIKQQSKK